MQLLVRLGFAALFLSVPILFAARRRYGVSITVCVLFAALSFFATEANVFAFYLAAIPLLLILRNNNVRPRTAALVMGIWAISGIGGGVVADLREYRTMQTLYPKESLAERLNYEVARSIGDAPIAIREIEVPPAPDESNDAADDSRAHRRREGLQELHSQTFAEFAAANGFGATRMQSFRRWSLRVDPLPTPKPFPQRPQITTRPTAIQNSDFAAVNEAPPPLPRQSEVVRQFTERINGVYIPTRQQAVGFVPHAFADPPKIHGSSAEDWQLSRLELVSLLKFDAPRVYLSEHLPRMDELRNAETRPADEFEQQALQQLRNGEDIVVDQQLNTIRMVGAVRATKQCLDCHSVRRGELLGAFSYLLDRKQPIPPPKVESKPVSMTRRPSHDS